MPPTRCCRPWNARLAGCWSTAGPPGLRCATPWSTAGRSRPPRMPVPPRWAPPPSSASCARCATRASPMPCCRWRCARPTPGPAAAARWRAGGLNMGDLQPADVDVAVVGAGVIGVACALQLARQGLRVQVFDPDGVGQGASFGNAGHLATEQVFPIADLSILKRLPGMLLDPMGPLRLDWTYLPRATPGSCACCSTCGRRPSPAPWLGCGPSTKPAWAPGAACSRPSSGPTCCARTVRCWCTSRTPPARRCRPSRHAWPGRACRWRSGGGGRSRGGTPAQRGIRGGLFFPATGHFIDPHRVVVELARAAEALGVTFHRQRVLDGQRLAGRRPEAGRRQPARPPGAAGLQAPSAPLTEGLTGTRVPLDTERGYHLMLPGSRGGCRSPSPPSSGASS